MNILFSLCWLGEPWRIDRYTKWLSYHLAIKDSLGFDKIVLLDNASDLNDLRKLGGTIMDEKGNLIELGNPDILIYRFDVHMPRTGIHEYPYCWRGLEYCKQLVTSLSINKILFIDSDFYILTKKLAQYIKTLDTGWISFWCHKYGWPEAALHILCKDTLSTLLNFPIPSFTHYNNRNMEELLPFTKVLKTEFKGDRYGEGAEPQKDDMDYYGQWGPGCPDMKFEGSA